MDDFFSDYDPCDFGSENDDMSYLDIPPDEDISLIQSETEESNDSEQRQNVCQMEPNVFQIEPNAFQQRQNFCQMEPNAFQIEPNAFQQRQNVCQMEPNAFQIEPNAFQQRQNFCQMEPNVFQIEPNAFQQRQNFCQIGPIAYQVGLNACKQMQYANQKKMIYNPSYNGFGNNKKKMINFFSGLTRTPSRNNYHLSENEQKFKNDLYSVFPGKKKFSKKILKKIHNEKMSKDLNLVPMSRTEYRCVARYFKKYAPKRHIIIPYLKENVDEITKLIHI